MPAEVEKHVLLDRIRNRVMIEQNKQSLATVKLLFQYVNMIDVLCQFLSVQHLND